MTELQQKTQAHYDEFPFIEGGDNRVAWWRDYLRDFLPDDLIRDKLVADIGSSVGEITRGLLDRGARMVCLDLSQQSLERCAQINPEATVLHGTALDLPFPDGAFDHAISIGVLHHTPDCRRGFHELARITAPGGTVVVFLYNFWNVYNVIYKAFAPVRWAIPLERVPKWMLWSMQPFAKSHLKQELDPEQLRRLLGDKLWTPQATFHSIAQLRRWGEQENLTFVAYKRFYLGYANVVKFVKNGRSTQTARRELRLCCPTDGHGDMTAQSDGYACDHCSRRYPTAGGIIDCAP